jgi:hypothetical protein
MISRQYMCGNLPQSNTQSLLLRPDNPYSGNLMSEPPTIQHTIPTPSARQSLLQKPHGKAQIFIHHGSRRPQPASQSAVSVTSTPGMSSGINTGGATRQSQSRSRTRLCSYSRYHACNKTTANLLLQRSPTKSSESTPPVIAD